MNPRTLPTVLIFALERGARLVLMVLIQMYRWILSPLKTALMGDAARCRFTPSCSQYALVALQRHGAVTGAFLAARRICRCHPWGGQGCDPVPEVPAGRPSPSARDTRCHRVGKVPRPGLPALIFRR